MGSVLLDGEGFDYIIDFFQAAAMEAIVYLYPVSKYLLIVLGIITLSTVWSFYEGEIKQREVIQKIFSFSTIFFLITFWKWFVKHTFLQLAALGKLAATGNAGPYDDSIMKASSIMNKGFEVSKEITTKIEQLSLMSNFGDITFLYIAAFLTITAFWFIAFQLTLTTISYYIIAMVAMILLPLGQINFLKSYFQKAVGGIINLGIRVMITFFMLGLIQKLMTKLNMSASPNSNIDYVHNALIIMAVGYAAYKIPEFASDVLSGSPSFGNSSVAALGAAAGAYVGTKGSQLAHLAGGAAYRAAGSAIYKGADYLVPGMVDNVIGSERLAKAREAVNAGANFEQAMQNSGEKNVFDRVAKENEKIVKNS